MKNHTLCTQLLISILLIGSSACRPREAEDPVRNITEGVLNGILDIVQGTGALIQNITEDASQTIGLTVDRVLNVTNNATQNILGGVWERGPQLLNDSAVVIQGIAKTSDDSRPVIQNGVDEYTRQMALASKFLSAYTEVSINNLRNFVEFFGSRLQCNTQCERMATGSQEREDCEKKFCIDFKPPSEHNLTPEDYVDSTNPEEKDGTNDKV